MVTIDKVDFTKLKPYDGKTTKCFEQFCYQIAQKEFGHLGTFTPIDGSGGDGGVEFYLKLHNGEKWGWQCKFFGDTGRLNVGSRDSAIEGSFETAIRNHNDLTKWFLCLKTDLTADSLSSKGKFSKGERNWFENELTKIIPSGKIIALEHWGETSFVNFLKDSKHIGIRSFFFGELEFNQDWFKKIFYENFEKVIDKYDSDLHTIDRYTQSKIDFLLIDSNYTKLTGELKKELLEKSNAIETALYDFRDERMLSSKEHIQRGNFFLICQEFKNHISYVFEKIDFVESCFINCTPELLPKFDLEELNKNFFEYFNKIDYRAFEEKSRAFKDASSISYLISDFGESYNSFFRNYFHKKQRVIHFIADAAKGKTHISCDIAYRKIADSKPAIFITGDKFTDETSIVEALRRILDIPQEFTFDDFLQALDVYASILNTQLPLVIDGLNETISSRLFSPIWKNHLSAFISKVLQTKNLIVITTCRKSYVNRIWDKARTNEFHYLYGFDDYETIHEAVRKYFSKYKLKTDLFFAPLEKFRDPIFLKIFCEIKNPNWKTSGEVAVNIEEESSYDVFREYLSQVNNRVTNNNPILKANEQFIAETLNKLSLFLWNNNTREIPVNEFYNLIDGKSDYEKDKSRADILINEGLVVTRDMRDKSEYVSFTYDILAGFMVGEYLIQKHPDISYFISKKFIQKIIVDSKQHPFFEDVISALCLLLPQLKQASFHELSEKDKLLKFTKSTSFKYLPKFIKNCFTDRINFSSYTFSKSVASLFVLPAKAVKGRDTNLVAELFLGADENKETFYNLFFKTLGDVKHPLNAVFFSKLLAYLKMNERDISWTEYFRKKSYDLEEYILEFEAKCRSNESESKLVSEKQHIVSRVIVWFLTSTNRNLRDKATKALYFYGRKFPKEFSTLVYDSLKFNDPYVWERTLASLYGVVMAEHNSTSSDNFRIHILPEISKTIFDLIFKENAPHSTTHILARDYSRRIIEIGLVHNPSLFTEKEIKNIRPPYTFGGVRNLGEFDYGDRDYGYDGPIHMDFSNYTIGRIVKDGGSYSNPLEKQKVRRQIYWRIYDLGWNEELFKEAEKALGNANYYSGGRTEQAIVERYGKKYSWIAYYENAGLRDDLGLLDKDWDRFRLSDADIDPSFPEKQKSEVFFTHNLLGDTKTPLVDWYEDGGMPFVEEYLKVKDLKGNNGDWICLDSFIVQEDMLIERNCFAFIRGFIIANDDYEEAIKLFRTKNLKWERLPEKRHNHYTFSGELYYCQEATYDNEDVLEFEIEKKKVKIKKGEPGYFPAVFWDSDTIKNDFPEEIEQEVSSFKEFETLMPVMEYNWEGYHSSTNNAGQTTIVGKEIANHLNLINQPQTFDLLDDKGNLSSKNIEFHADYNNNHSFVYIRKDLFDKYLAETNSKFIWVIWGERDVRFKTEERRQEYFKANPFKEHQVFRKVIEYEK
ncbi:NACHT domain-containing protein [Arundinibacter roseus]|uniref:ATP-binding protein n=1 Tax=Arundinibacter roseus TaxID=2070510 RepID=A0A4R4K8K2_9BACT|nr:hypothetical protein [Arundinibacter roseus]TDB63958.1 hypothetical protein EZE20_13495 [Arundinibacter roseus]